MFEIYGRDTIARLLEASLASCPLLWLEDVLVTGYMAQLAKVDRYALDWNLLLNTCASRDVNNVRSRAVIGDKCTRDDFEYLHNHLANSNPTKAHV